MCPGAGRDPGLPWDLQRRAEGALRGRLDVGEEMVEVGLELVLEELSTAQGIEAFRREDRVVVLGDVE
eukprot:13480812-Heterocapsa_arctica.AAC.1